MLNYRGDIYLDTTTFKGVCTKDYNLFAVTTSPNNIRKYTTNSISFIASGGLAATPTGITFITPSSICISYNTNRVDIWDANTMASSVITTNTAATQTTYHQQIAGNPNLSLAMLTRQGVAGVTLVSPTCATSIVPSFLSGRTVNCVISRPDSGTWILGTNGGRIYEMTSTGVQITAVYVPSGPTWGTTPIINVMSLAWSPSYLLAATDCGQLLHYDWSTKTLVNQSVIPFNGNGINPNLILSNAASGTCIMAGGGTINNWKVVNEMHFNTSRLSQESYAPIEINSGCLDAGINPDVKQGWVIINTSQSIVQLRLFDMPEMGQVDVSTTIQDPPGVYGSGRIIRIRDSGPGTASVDYDGVIPNVATNLPATDGKNYIELGLIGNTITGLGPYTSWDIRQMEA